MQPRNDLSKRGSRLHGDSLRFLLAGASAVVSVLAVTPALAAATAGAPSARCPRDMALVGKSCVDKFEGSLVEVKADGSEVPWSAHMAPNGHLVKAVSRAGVTPQAHISMHEAQKACKNAGKRLCHAGEWKAACAGPEKTRYPYGNDRQPGACVDANRTAPVMKIKGGRYDHTSMNDPMLNQLPNTVEPTGTTSTCTNSYGVHDMVGNVHEWADDGAFHGGYYLDTKINGEGCSYKTTAHAPSYYDYSTGFRCCADAGTLPADEEPTTPDKPSDAVAANDAPMSPASAPAPEAPHRADAVSGFFHDGETGLEAPYVAETADRQSFYPV